MENKNKSLLLRSCKWLKVVYERFKQMRTPQWKHKECDKIVSKHKKENIKHFPKRVCRLDESERCDKIRCCRKRNEHYKHTYKYGVNMKNGVVINFFNTAILTVTIAQLVSPINCCYVFPPGKRDPCEGHECHIGAICVSSSDGYKARCQCPECYSYGDSVGSTPVCGNDGQDYANLCELKLASCNTMREIMVKYYGKCSKCEIGAPDALPCKEK